MKSVAIGHLQILFNKCTGKINIHQREILTGQQDGYQIMHCRFLSNLFHTIYCSIFHWFSSTTYFFRSEVTNKFRRFYLSQCHDVPNKLPDFTNKKTTTKEAPMILQTPPAVIQPLTIF